MGGCGAVGGERLGQADVKQWALRGSLRRVWAGGCDAVGGERQFKEGLGGRM